jgi:hypothetical protein
MILSASPLVAALAFYEAKPPSILFCVSASMALRTRLEDNILVFIYEITRFLLSGISVFRAHFMSEK